MIVHMIGNAHIDPVWLWGWQAGVDETLATFRSAADRCDEFPEFIFTRGEAWTYQQVERLDPELFDRVRRLISAGKWHITGGQYLQPDVNLPTEMGLHRQILHGQRYFKDRFGISPRVGYNVDSFGHPATMPDLLGRHDYLAYVFHRPHPDQVALPAQTFRWRGVNGGEVIGFRIVPGYTTRSDDLEMQIMKSVGAADPALGHTMCFYGVGNHGGGPTKGHIAYVLEHAHAFPDIELRFSTPEAFFEAVLPKREALPVVTSELQRTFPGCYSVMHDIKQEQRHGEHLLDQCARLIDGFEKGAGRKLQLHARLDTAWDDLLFTAFHDILAGTSVPSAWHSVRAMQGRARISGEELLVEVSRRWARETLPEINYQHLVVINPDSASREGLVEAEPWLDLDAWGGRWLSDLEGRPVDYQLVQPEAPQLVTRLVFPARVAAGQGMQVLVRDDPPPDRPSVTTDLQVGGGILANSHLRLELADHGIEQLSVGGRTLLGTGGIGLQLRHDSTDTWTFHTDHFSEPVASVFKGNGWMIEETGPLRARLRTEGTLGDSSLRWTLSLQRNDPRLFMRLEITFNERFKALQLPIHLSEAPAGWTAGLAGGQVQRSPDLAEWPVQGWSRMAVAGQKLALVSSDAYSLSLADKLCGWTLLRSPRMAWGGGQPQVYAGRDWHTDQGPHVFDFVLMTGESLSNEMLHTATRQQAQPLIVFDRYEGMNRPLRSDKRNQAAQPLFQREGEEDTRH